MIIKIAFKDESEKKQIINDNKDKYLLEVEYLLNVNFLIFSDTPTIEILIQEQANKISILEAENAELLLDSAMKDLKINTIENDLADLTLEIAMGGM